MSSAGAPPLVITRAEGGPPLRVRVPLSGEAVIGRDEECQVFLDEDAVSRQHAKILYMERRPEVLDLGSMNGTFLNGKRVQRAFLKSNDRIQVGAHVLVVSIGDQVVEAAAGHAGDAARAASLMKASQPSGGTRSQASALSGELTEIKLISLLQVIESDRSTGTLVILSGGQEGKLYVHQGLIRHATYGRARGPKALYRMAALEEGKFDFFVPGRSPEYDTVEGSLQSHLLEAMRQKDEFEVWKTKLPPENTRLALNPSKHLVPAKVPVAVFDVLAAIVRDHTVGNVIENCQLPDSDICRVLLALLKHEVATVEKKPKGKKTLPG